MRSLHQIIITICIGLLTLATGVAAQEKPVLSVQLGHAGSVSAITFTRDGHYAISAGSDKTLKLWDVVSGREVRTYRGHEDAVNALAISPDSTLIASVSRGLSGSKDKNLMLWETFSGKQLRHIKVPHGRVTSAVFTPDGRSLVAGGFGNSWDEKSKNLALYDLATGRELRLFGDAYSIHALAITPDGRYLLSNGFGGGREHFVRVWDLATGREVRIFGHHKRTIEEIAVSADGSYVLTVSRLEKTATVWSFADGREVRTFKGKEGLYKAAISPDGTRVVAADEDGSLRLWDVQRGRELAAWRQIDVAGAVAFSPDGTRFLSGGRGVMKLWDAVHLKELHTLSASASSVYSVATSSDGNYAVAGTYRKDDLRLWDIRSGRKIDRVFKGYSGTFDSKNVAISPDGNRLFSQTGDYSIKLWKMADGSVERTLSVGAEPIRASVFLPGGEYVLVAVGQVLKLLDVSSKHQQGVLLGTVFKDTPAEKAGLRQGDLVVAVDQVAVDSWDAMTGIIKKNPDRELSFTFVRTGQRSNVAITPAAAMVKDQDGKEEKVGRIGIGIGDASIRQFRGHRGAITDLAVTPDGRYAVSGSKDRTVRLWDVAAGSEIRTLGAFESKAASFIGEVAAVAISPDGRYVVAAANLFGQAPLKVWDTSTGSELLAIGKRPEHEQYMPWFSALAFSMDGNQIIGADGDFLKVWDRKTGALIKVLEGHAGLVKSIAITPDGKQIVSASLDGTVRIWDLASGREKVHMVTFDDGEWIVVTSEGYYNASANGDKYLNVRVGPNVYGIENYREAFFRPDLVRLALSGGSLQGYRTLAEIKQPPRVSIVQTPEVSAAEEFKLTVKLEEQGGGIGDVRLFLNGSAIMLDSARALKAVQKDSSGTVYRSYTLRLAPGTNSIRAVAFNADNSMQSNEALHQVQAGFAALRKPTLHALVIGIQEFRNPKLQLKYAVADANLFATTLRSGAAGLFEQVKVTSLTAREATSRDALLKALRSYGSLNPDDLFILYIASHGTVDEGEYFLITSNVGALSTQRLRSDALSQAELKELVANIPSTKKLIVIDTCNAGQLGEAMQTALLTRGMSEDTAMKVLSRAVGSTILSASTSVQEALEGYQGHGLFTWALVQGLQGKADKGKTGYVRTTDLAAYVEDEVPNLAEKIFKRAQFPTVSISGQGFPVGKVR